MNDLQSLQKDTKDIACPCTNPDCPFRAKSKTESHLTSELLTSSSEDLDDRIRQNGTPNDFSSYIRRRHRQSMDPSLYRSDCEIAIEEEPDSDDSYEFKRNTPSRMARRRMMHSSGSSSLSHIANKRHSRLSLPSPSLFTPSCRSLSLPGHSFPSEFQFVPDFDGLMHFQRARGGTSASA